MIPIFRWICLLGLAAGLAACPAHKSGGDGGLPDADGDDGAADGADDGGLPDGADGLDGADGDSGDGDGDDPAAVCRTLGLPSRPFVDAEEDHALYALAADFSVPTTEGSWRLSAHWSGCEVYLFIQDAPEQASGWPVPLWDRDVDRLIAALPDNTHVFFISGRISATAREEALAKVQGQVTAYLETLEASRQAWWRERIHFVTEKTTRLGGWLAQQMFSPGWGVAIDRFQRQRYIGSYADYARYDPDRSWFAPNLAMAANEAVYYNFEAARQEDLEARPATEIPVFDKTLISDPDWAGQKTSAEITLPSAEEMAAFDTLELDLTLACQGDGEYGDCPAWDYLVYLYLCDEADPDVCEVELGRWITTYHREGRWVHDVSALLPLMASGGDRRLAFYSQQPYEVSLTLRLSSGGRADRPVAIVPLFSGGTFDAEYNVGREPLAVPIPADAGRVALASVLSGHGMASPGNCAEFCDVHHHFRVNGQDNVLSFPQAGTDQDCMDQVAQGTVPNQYGTWWYGRSGWCPGREVPLIMTDVSEQITPGQDAVIEYEALRNDALYQGQGASIRLSSWLVIYR